MPHMMTLSAQRAMMTVPPMAPTLTAAEIAAGCYYKPGAFPWQLVKCCTDGGVTVCKPAGVVSKLPKGSSGLPSEALLLAPGTSFQRMRNLGISRR